MRRLSIFLEIGLFAVTIFAMSSYSTLADMWVYNLSPSNTGVISSLPNSSDKPEVGDLNGTPLYQHSSSNFTTRYNFYTNSMGTNLWNGVMIHWPD
ncbi:MAG: hypothetical protein V2A34_11300, partial [Lentisphaerota bacterium]